MLERFTLSGTGGTGVVLFNGMPLDPGPSQSLRNHSPDGFAWGYGGSGPAQLALAVLMQAGMSHSRALKFYQLFKVDYVVRLPRTFDVQIDLGTWCRQNDVPNRKETT